MKHNEIFDYSNFKSEKTVKSKICFGVVGLAHAHIYRMCNGLISAGAELKYVYEDNETLLENFKKAYPFVEACSCEERIYEKQDIELIVSAAIPSQRAEIAIAAMKSGKDFFVDKAPVITLEQLNAVKEVRRQTERKYFVYYGESIDSESTIFAYDLIKRGVIGEVFYITGSAPHVLNYASRPTWFFEREKSGGILIDIGSHQVHQFLNFTGSDSAEVEFARVSNFSYPQKQDFDQSGEMLLKTKNGITGSFRLDWDAPKGLNTWGDPRTVIEGEKGYIELRKNINIGFDNGADNVFVVTDDGIFYETVGGKVGVSFFADLLQSIAERNNTEAEEIKSFNAIETAIKAQTKALNGDKKFG
ncbi:MAG: Gfo/Idh/MocA family oxidoreductase [Clostridia bacterium]|nr:Gfo/Idh/MocA family oxidoreductase [Clostridia bacterium]